MATALDTRYKAAAASLFDACVKQVDRAILVGSFQDEGPVFRGSQSYKGRRSRTGPPGTFELARELATHLLTCSAADIDFVANKYVPYDGSELRHEGLGVAEFDSHLTKTRPPDDTNWQWYPWSRQDWAASVAIRAWPQDAASGGHRLLATALGVGSWQEVWVCMWSAVGNGMFEGCGGIRRMAATMLFLFRLNQGAPWNHNWDYGGYNGTDAMLDIRDVVNGYIHYVLKGAPPPDPRASLPHMFTEYAGKVLLRYMYKPGGPLARIWARKWGGRFGKQEAERGAVTGPARLGKH